jgi:hypothetical protein
MTTTIARSQNVDHLDPITRWEHWDTIKQVAQREYGMSDEQFAEALPEYQRFLGLILAGNTGVPMHSEQVDTIWHSHILCTTLYVQFCEQIFGRYIHHVPNLSPSSSNKNCVSPDPCASKCLSICKTPPPKCTEKESSAVDFRTLYTQLYGVQPPAIWNLPVADGMSC